MEKRQAMKIISKILLLILVPIIPSIPIIIAANITFRIPDIYRYEMNRSGITQEINLTEPTDNLARFFSDYMLGTLDSFQYTAFFMGRERPIFGIGEEAFMSQCRNVLNMSLVVLVLMAAAFLFIVWFLFWRKEKQVVRIAYYAGSVLYAITGISLIAIILIDELRGKIYTKFAVYKFEETDLLPQLLSAGPFFSENLTVIIVISLIFITFGYSIIKRLTYPDRMFY